MTLNIREADIRAPKPDEMRVVANTVADALISTRLSDEEWTAREAGWIDFDSLAAWDGDRCVGHVGAFRLDTTVPGGARVKTSGVTRVGVLPTHTRRGLLTSMMRQLLIEARGEGAALASLRASEGVIYERYGFAIAGEGAAVKVTTRSMGPVRSPAEGKITILSGEEFLDVVPPLYDRCARRRVGSVSRPQFFWPRILGDAISVKKPSFVAVHHDPAGCPDGYVHYDVRWAEQTDGSELGAGELHELFGADPAIERALWAYLLDIDLITTWKADNRPIDEAIRFAVRDTRAYKVHERWDEQWLRILDVDEAISARSYRACNRTVAVQVTDPLFAANEGTWRIGADGGDRTDDEPDLSVAIGSMSAAYLGGTTWRELADAGHVEVRRETAVDDADTLFAQRPAPFCGTFF